MSRDEIPNLVPGMRESCTEFWDKNRIMSVPLYAPRVSTTHGVLSYPSTTGGPNWAAAPTIRARPLFHQCSKHSDISRRCRCSWVEFACAESPDPRDWSRPAGPRRQHTRHPFSFRTEGYSVRVRLLAWGELVAVDVQELQVAWRVPLGITESLGKKGTNTGAPNLGGSIVTASGGCLHVAYQRWAIRAFDAPLGKDAVGERSAGQAGTPRRLLSLASDGRQYVTVAAAGPELPAGGYRLSGCARHVRSAIVVENAPR